jgi:hypothetical protein
MGENIILHSEEPILVGDGIVGKTVGEIENLCGIEVEHLGPELSFQNMTLRKPSEKTIIKEGFYIQVKGLYDNHKKFFEIKYNAN